MIASTSTQPLTLSTQRLCSVWLFITIASSGIVLFEPAPFDVLMCGFVGLILVLGQAVMTPRLVVYVLGWIVIGVASLAAAAGSLELRTSLVHTIVTIYLSLTSVAIAAFIAAKPESRSNVLMNGYLVAALVAGVAGIVGYAGVMDLLQDDLTKYGRARGTFKDPNVLGAFIVPPTLYCVHMIMTRRSASVKPYVFAAPILLLALFLTFSRGAWVNLGLSLVAYVGLSFLFATEHRIRLRLVGVGLATACLATALVSVALIDESTQGLLTERAQIVQDYDNQRLAGQQKAATEILAAPKGVGAGVFFQHLHAVDVHNVYLNMYLNAGWIGGAMYLCIVLATALVGFTFVARRGLNASVFLPIYCSFLGLIAEGMIIDTDHWRHFYIVLGGLWGVIAASNGAEKQPPARQRVCSQA